MFTKIGTIMLKMDMMRGKLFDGVSFGEVIRDEVPDDEKKQSECVGMVCNGGR